MGPSHFQRQALERLHAFERRLSGRTPEQLHTPAITNCVNLYRSLLFLLISPHPHVSRYVLRFLANERGKSWFPVNVVERQKYATLFLLQHTSLFTRISSCVCDDILAMKNCT